MPEKIRVTTALIDVVLDRSRDVMEWGDFTDGAEKMDDFNITTEVEKKAAQTMLDIHTLCDSSRLKEKNWGKQMTEKSNLLKKLREEMISTHNSNDKESAMQR